MTASQTHLAKELGATGLPTGLAFGASDAPLHAFDAEMIQFICHDCSYLDVTVLTMILLPIAFKASFAGEAQEYPAPYRAFR